MVPQGRFELPAYSLPMSYSTPELLRLKFLLFLFIKNNNNRPLIAHITERTYILKVNPKYSAIYPTITGPKIKPAKPNVAKFDTVKLIGSLELLIACRYTTAIKFAVPKPNNIIPGIIKLRFIVTIDNPNIIQENKLK